MVEVCAHPAEFSSQEEKSTEHAYCHEPLDNEGADYGLYRLQTSQVSIRLPTKGSQKVYAKGKGQLEAPIHDPFPHYYLGCVGLELELPMTGEVLG